MTAISAQFTYRTGHELRGTGVTDARAATPTGLGALVCGRTLFDFTGGWGGTHTMDVPVVVVTHQIPTAWVAAHPQAPFHFVTDGEEAAVARAHAIAGERTITVTVGTIARQCLEHGLLGRWQSTWCPS